VFAIPDAGSTNRMDREINIDSILALDAGIIRLKRSRNSLLNIARVPPEILGKIFYLNVMPEFSVTHFPEIQAGSYNFLLVCHRWFEVARCTPGLWSFWGNSLEDWRRRYLCPGTAPLDLVLNMYGSENRCGSLDEALRDVLRDRAAHDAIRTVHLTGPEDLLATIISLLTPDGEDIKHSSIESIYFSCVDASDFFARQRFPRLRDLYFSWKLRISSWDDLRSHTMGLTSLSFFRGTSPIPTASQVLSLLAANPNIRTLELSLEIEDDGGRDSDLRVPLRHLERLSLDGNIWHVFSVLHRLELPERVDDTTLEFYGCTLKEIREVIGPYIRDYLGREDRLGIFLSSDNSLSLHASVIGTRCHGADRLPQQSPPRAEFSAELVEHVSWGEKEKLYTDILAFLPRERVVYFKTDLRMGVVEELLIAMDNVESLHLISPVVSEGFMLPNPNGPNAHKKLLPSLQRLYLEQARTSDCNWDPLIAYLAHQTSGNQAISLNVSGDVLHICSGLVKQIDDLVEEFVYIPGPESGCPFKKPRTNRSYR
jgi:hypothetical protein